jgi:hypothetical protein
MQVCYVQEFFYCCFLEIFFQFFSLVFTINSETSNNIVSSFNEFFNFIHKSLLLLLCITFQDLLLEIFATISAFVISFLIYYIVIIEVQIRNLKTIIQANSLKI